LTNGDSYPDSAVSFFKKKLTEITAQDYIHLGRQRQEEAVAAAGELGLKNNDLFFLSYPDQGLASMWEAIDSDLYRSKATDLNRSSYGRTWGLAKTGYSRRNLLQDLKNIIQEFRPGLIYVSAPEDSHTDHQAAADFINKALDDLRDKDGASWVNAVRVKYYIIHRKYGSPDPNLSASLEKEQELKVRKERAWGRYSIEKELPSEKKLGECFKETKEFFRDVPAKKEEYLKSVYKEWENIARLMKGMGYNLNLGPVGDVAEDINDPGMDLVRKGRIFSDNPDRVIELAGNIAEALESTGVIPVIKHFPGLGSAAEDTHKRLARINKSRVILYEKDIFPFRELIRRNGAFWIMTSHAVYPALDDKPASLSYKIQTGILREELGFKGIIIADELLMQAMAEYAVEQGLSVPSIGEIAVLAFKAGTDIALINPAPGKEEEVVAEVLTAVKKALEENRISAKEINDSVLRILKEKERVFGRPLCQHLRTLTLDKKIAQKIMIDTRNEYDMVQKYGLGGIEARERGIIEKAQRSSEIPLFVACQHEGGRINESRKLNIYTASAYLIGREYERTFNNPGQVKAANKCQPGEQAEKSFFDLSRLNKVSREGIINILLSDIDEYIGFYSNFKKGTCYLNSPNHSGPLDIDLNNPGVIILKPFKDCSLMWLREFPDKNTALCAYEVLKESFSKWGKNKDITPWLTQNSISYADKMIARLILLKGIIRESGDKQSQRKLRVLCLAAHPDDEDAPALVFFKSKFNAETCILLATRGQGGENQIGRQLYEELGALRTEEIERSGAILGVNKIYYLGKDDFGYCFDPAEALSRWDKQDTLYKLVYFYRLIKPDLIITRHNTGDQHCQHQALALLAQEAFVLSGNPQVYPEMLKNGLLAWQPGWFYQRQPSNKEGALLADIMIDLREKIPAEGKTYAQIAAEALSQHKSQGISVGNGMSGKIAYELVTAKTMIDQKFVLQSEEKTEKIPSGVLGIKIAADLKTGLFEENSDDLFIALKTLGCNFTKIDARFISEGDMSQFNTILVGKGLKDIQDAGNRLIEFVVNGGNLDIL
jgi:beta-glucosidase-like glycosyl hydrolase/LmbE family N-acetylglucosaminyl deacetylase